MNKKHVDVVVKYFYPVAAGIENNIMQTYTTLQDTLGWDVTIHTSRDTYTERNVLVQEESINGLHVKRYAGGLFGFLPDINWEKTDVVALHNFDMFFVRYFFRTLILKLRGKKNFALILTPHGGFSPEWSMFHPVARFIKKTYTHTLGAWLINVTVDSVRAVSEWERLEEVKYITSDKVHLIDNGLEDEAYGNVDTLASDAIKTAVKNYGRYIIQVARVSQIKNMETTIQALQHMPNDLKFVIVGQLQDPAYERKLKALIIQLRLEHRVIFTGVIRGVDKYYLYRNAVAMVHMALWESGCNVVREGMSQGLPCIVSNVYGLPGLVKDGLNGFCLPVRDSKRVAEKVLWILDPQNTEYVQKMREVNISFGMGQSWKDVAQKMDTLYKSYTPRNMGSVSFSIFLLLRNSLYSMTALLDRFFPNHTPRIVIYCYHSISDDGLRFSVTAENFKKQMELLLKNQVPLSVRDLPMYLRGEKKLVRDAFIITFDDGYADIITMKDFLESKNISPTAFVLSCPEEANYAELETKKEFLSVMQLKDLKESGWEIGSHSGTHTDFLHLSADQMDREIEKSKKELEERLGSSIKYFAYPKGVYTQEILETVSKAGYSLAFSMDDGYANSQHHHFVLPRVGVDGTHSLQQFSHLASPLAMKSRKFIKKVLRLV